IIKLQILINKITHSDVAKVKASRVFGTKYCKAAPAIIKAHENIKPLAGTERFDRCDKAAGACWPRANPKSIRLVENTPLFMEDMTDDKTTRFMMIAAAPIPACMNKLTKGL